MGLRGRRRVDPHQYRRSIPGGRGGRHPRSASSRVAVPVPVASVASPVRSPTISRVRFRTEAVSSDEKSPPAVRARLGELPSSRRVYILLRMESAPSRPGDAATLPVGPRHPTELLVQTPEKNNSANKEMEAKKTKASSSSQQHASLDRPPKR